MKQRNVREGIAKYIEINELLNDILREISSSEPDEEFVQQRVRELNDRIRDAKSNCFVVESAVGDNDHMLLFHFNILSVPTPSFLSRMLGDDDETDK